VSPYQRRLRRYADRHPPARVLLFHCDGTMVVETTATHNKHGLTVRRETIPATFAALRAWLGY
jgi:hypothetical protein